MRLVKQLLLFHFVPQHCPFVKKLILLIRHYLQIVETGVSHFFLTKMISSRPVNHFISAVPIYDFHVFDHKINLLAEVHIVTKVSSHVRIQSMVCGVR